MDYKSLREFAAEKKVTMRAIQRHIKNHENDLEGHIVRYGPPRGTYIDEYAQEYIAGLLAGHPLEVMDQGIQEENERLKHEIDELKTKMIAIMEDRDQLTRKALEAAQEAGDKISNLEAALREAETRAQEAKGRAERAEAETQALKKRSLWQRITRFGE